MTTGKGSIVESSPRIFCRRALIHLLVYTDLNVLKTEIAASYVMFLAYNISGGIGARKIDTKIEREPRYC